MAELVPQLEYIVQHRVVDGRPGQELREYGIGERFDTAGVTPAEIAQLRKLGAIKLREEIEAAETTADRIAQLEMEKRMLLAKLDELTAKPAEQAEPATASEGEKAEAEPAKKSAAAK